MMKLSFIFKLGLFTIAKWAYDNRRMELGGMKFNLRSLSMVIV